MTIHPSLENRILNVLSRKEYNDWYLEPGRIATALNEQTSDVEDKLKLMEHDGKVEVTEYKDKGIAKLAYRKTTQNLRFCEHSCRNTESKQSFSSSFSKAEDSDHAT